jgi:hypothetical protein
MVTKPLPKGANMAKILISLSVSATAIMFIAYIAVRVFHTLSLVNTLLAPISH